jgi:hypothetical protein
MIKFLNSFGLKPIFATARPATSKIDPRYENGQNDYNNNLKITSCYQFKSATHTVAVTLITTVTIKEYFHISDNFESITVILLFNQINLAEHFTVLPKVGLLVLVYVRKEFLNVKNLMSFFDRNLNAIICAICYSKFYKVHVHFCPDLLSKKKPQDFLSYIILFLFRELLYKK